MSDRPRVPGLRADEWTDEVRARLLPTLAPVAALEGDHGVGAGDDEEERKPLAVLTVLAHAPALLGPFLDWASALALEGRLPRRDHELLALRAAWNCRSPFEWGHHVVYARAAGLSDAEIAEVVAGPDAPGWTEHEAALLRAADQLHGHSDVDDATWGFLAGRYDATQLVEIPMIVGQYTMLSMLTNATGVELEPGHDPLPPDPNRDVGDANGGRTPPVRSTHPPAWVMGFANPVSRALARTPAGRLFRSLVVLEFDGRRTGRHYAVPVMTYEYDGGLVAFTDARWALNFTGGAPVVVRRHGRAHPGSALLAGADESAAGLRAVLAGLKSPGRLGLAIDEGHAPTDAELAAARSMIRLTLEGPSGGR